MFHSAFKQAARVSQCRLQSTATFVTQKKAAGTSAAWKQAWVSDPSTYPLIAIMGIAGCMVLGMGSACLMYNPDVQINPNKRGATMRNWEK
mmetsp:Transcript_13672/g.21946  ORF Transcript_13672/g.21946 Transcript_13672/m.21946 type:complete len:91 (-) Transcript_13672:135-407(-)|eukprot:CAMPEP_0178767132 /NCGR_PEP_ID=MMETSP0744-20121128/19465_1 /TAXON_ID=913974 /ORGANISM="Nitzschia punctata, Strain CCMP561" /LENGTH=90 /DNA_ID=CAMNT_0020422961 /DNA_START=101 /DNA_END=373 /DNA_ORIENTATION=+